MLIVLLVLVFILWGNRKEPATPETSSSPDETTVREAKQTEPITATPDVDAAVDSFLLEAVAESKGFEQESANLNSVLGSDSAALQDLGGTYDPNEF